MNFIKAAIRRGINVFDKKKAKQVAAKDNKLLFLKELREKWKLNILNA